MPMNEHIWTVSEAKAKLSELLHLVEQEGPQRIGVRRGYRVVSEAEWQRLQVQRAPLGRWLRDNLPRVGELELPARAEPARPNPFAPDEAL